ncbi:MFS transporter [Herbiconiux sp. CPCC 203407]|uniref:MFS transporter n=1 Tax=Herbiconiux oxytropis TaxID=2970915 RepID=A0AA42BSE5_9MICO|nr:MFS transporter [Herbiconiux oxytropis]MCS5721080.1 MFS transporter [Herbiconiux oxytropis]MCS5724732.1 MFS transporter [Herbiconiux oxytropis]
MDSPARRWLAILALALGGFGIGVTEFVTMGLLPNIAADLLPAQYAADPAAANAQAGWLVSAYALGVVVGAPTIAAAAARWPRKRLLVLLVGVFVVGNLLSAILPSFELVLAARFFSALPHGAYFGIASLVAASLMGPGKRARGVAFVLGGLAIANVVGVPIGTHLGQSFGWRSTYLLVTVIFVITLIAIAITVPLRPGDPGATLRNELSAFTRVQVWLTLLLGSIGFAGIFAVYTFVAPVVTDVTGLDEGFVPWVLVAFGVGMTVGTFVSGWLTDRSVKLSLTLGLLGVGLSVLAFALTAQTVAGLLISIFFIGIFAGACSPAVQTRLMDVSQNAQSIAAALNHSALNIGNSLGAALGGVVIAAGFGYLSPAAVGVALAALGLAVLTVSFTLDRRARLRA